jgi:hypothetical protein
VQREQRRPHRLRRIKHAKVTVAVALPNLGSDDLKVGNQAGPTLNAQNLLPSRSRK